MDAGDIEKLFGAAGESYRFSRWSRPIVPVVFGIDDQTLAIFKGAIEAVVMLAGHRMAETDAELGVNVMMFFLRDWDELRAVPDLDRMVPGLHALCDRLEAAGANQYRLFRFEDDGAIRAAFIFLRLDQHLQAVPAEDIALDQAVQLILVWSSGAFAGTSPLARINGRVVLRPEIAAIIRAGYDPTMPTSARDASHALRLAARLPQNLLP